MLCLEVYQQTFSSAIFDQNATAKESLTTFYQITDQLCFDAWSRRLSALDLDRFGRLIRS